MEYRHNGDDNTFEYLINCRTLHNRYIEHRPIKNPVAQHEKPVFFDFAADLLQVNLIK